MAKRLEITPNARYRFLQIMNARMEESRFPPPEMDLTNDITFFGNEAQRGAELGYDQFFSYTKILPLYDKRKPKENRKFIPDTWQNIAQQEQPPKAVPATSSQWYGRRPGYDPDVKKFPRQNQIGTFYGKHVPFEEDDLFFTEETPNPRL